MASMSFKLFLLLLFLSWGLKPTFLESCSRVWKWTQSFVFFCGFLKGDLKISNNLGGLYFCCFWAFMLQKREMHDFICFWIVSHVTPAIRRKGLGQVVSYRKSKGGLIKWATIDERRGLLVNHNLRHALGFLSFLVEKGLHCINLNR